MPKSKEPTISEQIRSATRRLQEFIANAENHQVQLFLADQNILVDLNLKVYLWEDSVFVAHSSDLGLTSYGPDPEVAKDNFTIILDRFAQAYYERGMLETVLTKAGVTWTYKANDEVSGN